MTAGPSELWPVVCRLATGRPWPPREPADVAAFFEFANREYLLPLLMAGSGLPPEVEEGKRRYAALDALARRRDELSRAAARELTRILGGENFAFIKGADYRHRLYARTEHRQMNDIDVFIPAAEVPAAMSRLAAAGCPRLFSAHGSSFSPSFHEFSVEVLGVHVEVHRWFTQRIRARIDYEGLWRRRERFEDAGLAGCRLSPADALAIHCFQLAKDEFGPQLNRYVDLCLLLENYGDRIREGAELARSWAVERAYFGALHIVSNLFPSVRNAEIDEVRDGLLDARRRRFLVRRVLPDPSRERGAPAGRRARQLWRKFWLIDRAWRRPAFFAWHLAESALGSYCEWRARRSGMRIPARRGR